MFSEKNMLNQLSKKAFIMSLVFNKKIIYFLYFSYICDYTLKCAIDNKKYIKPIKIIRFYELLQIKNINIFYS